MDVLQPLIVLLLHMVPLVLVLIARTKIGIELLFSWFDPAPSGQVFDFIVVGGGSAGCVLASRLSEDPAVTVLLLEAGGEAAFFSGIPSLAAHLQMTPYDWQFQTEPQTNACLATEGRRCRWPRGKMLGGSGRLNFMLYARGSPSDYDYWSELGNPGWSYDEVLPYFKKSEKQQGRYRDDTQFHGVDGLIKVRDSETTPLAPKYLSMAASVNLPTGDMNGQRQIGFDIPQVMVDESGWRHDTYTAFLKETGAHLRPNLIIMKHSHATRILFDSSNRTATGVEIQQRSKLHRVLCRKEVILSAGAIGSPQLLMLSGVGPRQHLAQLGIPETLGLEGVGQNLHDHVTTMLGPFFVNEPITFDVRRLLHPANLWNFVAHGKGPLASTVACDSIGFLGRPNSTASEQELQSPVFQYHVTAVTIYADYGTYFPKVFGLRDDFYSDFVSDFYGRDGVTILPVILQPRSRGSVRLASADPMAAPLIDPRYFAHAEDVSDLVEAIQAFMKMVESSDELKSLGYRLPDKPLKECAQYFHGGPSDAYWECYVRHFTLTMYHPVGTCKMGPDARDAVVDAQLRVHGLNNVRVIDASVMPRIIRGNTHAPTVMIAEKGADLVKAFWDGQLRAPWNPLPFDQPAAKQEL